MWFFFTFLPCLLGILRYRFWAYWKWVVILQVWQVVGTQLFSAGGTLRDPTGDGLITHYVRVASNDGPAVALVGIVFLVVFYGGAFWFLLRLYKAARENQNPAAGVRGATVPRKAAEVTLLTAVVGGLLYWQFAHRLTERASSLPRAPQVV